MKANPTRKKIGNGFFIGDSLPGHYRGKARLNYLFTSETELLAIDVKPNYGVEIFAIVGDTANKVAYNVIVDFPRIPVKFFATC